MMQLRHRQSGFTLIMGLILLVMITLIAVTAINISSNQAQIVGNAQFRSEALAAAQAAIDLNLVGSFYAPVTQNIDVNGDGSADYAVTFPSGTTCVSAKPAKSSTPGLPKECIISGNVSLCYDAVFEVVANVSDAATGAQVTVTNGIKKFADVDTIAVVYNCD